MKRLMMAMVVILRGKSLAIREMRMLLVRFSQTAPTTLLRTLRRRFTCQKARRRPRSVWQKPNVPKINLRERGRSREGSERRSAQWALWRIRSRSLIQL